MVESPIVDNNKLNAVEGDAKEAELSKKASAVTACTEAETELGKVVSKDAKEEVVKQTKITDHFKPKKEAQEEGGGEAPEEEEKKGDTNEESKEVQELTAEQQEATAALLKKKASDLSSPSNPMDQYFS